MEFDEGVATIEHMLDNLPAELQSQERQYLKKVGNVIKKNVVKHLDNSDVESRVKESPKNHDGSRPYVHMKKDVKSSIRKSKTGELYVSVRGGKYTGYKWHMLNNGHIAKDGITFVPGTKFMERAMRDSEKDIEKVLDEMLREVTD